MVVYLTRSVRIACEGDGNITLQVKKVPQTGKQAGVVTWVNRGYYARIWDAAWAAIEKGVCDAKGAVQARELAAKVKEAAELVNYRVRLGAGATEESAPDREVVR